MFKKFEYSRLIISVFLCFFLISSDLCFSQTLKEAIDLLYKNNQKLKAEQNKIFESEANLMGGVLHVLPDIRYSRNIDQDIRVTNRIGQTFKQKVPKTRVLTLSQDISVSNTILSPVISKTNLDYTKVQFRFNEQQILLEAINIYLSVIEKKELLRIAIENYDISKKTSELIIKQFEVGDTTKTQVEYALSNLATRESIKIKSEGALVSANAAFKRVFGVEANNLVLPDKIPECLPEKFDRFAKTSVDNNLYLKSSGIQTDLSRLNVANSVASILPSLAVSYQKTKNDILEDLILNNTIKQQEVYQLSLRVPILPSGGAEYSRIIASKFGYNRALALEKYSFDQVNEEILSSWENLSVTNANLNAAQSAQKYAKEAMEAMKKEYEFGTRSVLELFDSERQYFETSVNFVISRSQKILSYYQALSTMGQLTKEIFS